MRRRSRKIPRMRNCNDVALGSFHDTLLLQRMLRSGHGGGIPATPTCESSALFQELTNSCCVAYSRAGCPSATQEAREADLRAERAVSGAYKLLVGSERLSGLSRIDRTYGASINSILPSFLRCSTFTRPSISRNTKTSRSRNSASFTASSSVNGL